MQYTNEMCKSCGRTFTDGDDVVVCPECGTPYHRSCWQENGRCVNTALHASGVSWQQVREQESVRVQQMPHPPVCPHCQRINMIGAAFCAGCGQPLQQTPPPPPQPQVARPEMPMPQLRVDDVQIRPDQPYFGMDPDEEMDGATVAELYDFVGKNQFYYLPFFLCVKRFGKKVSFNLTCLFFPSFYFAGRKMWGYAILLTILQLLLSVPAGILSLCEMDNYAHLAEVFHTSSSLFQASSMLCNILDFGMSLVLSLFGNYLYYRFATKKVCAIKKRSTSWAQCRDAFCAEGGFTWLGVLAVGASILFVSMMVAVMVTLFL